MVTSILAAKLYIPPPRAKIVLRPSLIERLNEGLSASRKLILISAPAGFGKTTLVSEWGAVCERPVTWLSLDEGDNDLTRFLTYFVAALHTLAPKIGAGVLAAVQTPHPPSIESILTTLLNEIAAIPDNFILVLDDYHVIDSEPIDHALTFLLDHLPPQMHLVIATREDPSLPLARLRARGQLTELRITDLRFTPSEAAEFLNQVMGLNLSTENITALEVRTEGWIAGLQLAALSMQGREDIASFIQAFTGSHRFLLDCLAEEVLQHQSERIRSFLLQTAILDRFCAPLCNAVTEREDGKEMLDVLERSNLFLIPLDDKRQWYRYHHLFAEVPALDEQMPSTRGVSNAIVILIVRDMRVITSTAIKWLERYAQDLKKQGIQLILADVNPGVVDVLKKSGALNVIGSENVFPATSRILAAENTAWGAAQKRLSDDAR